MKKSILTLAALATIGVAGLATSGEAEARRFGGHGFRGHFGHGFNGHRVGFGRFHHGPRFHRRHFGWFGAPVYVGAYAGCTWVKRAVATPYGVVVKWRPLCDL